MSYKQGDAVVHVRDGVCIVKGVEEKTLVADEPCEYYILSPVYDPGSRIYVPVDRGDTVLRKPLTKEEIESLIEQIPDMEIDWISDEKTRQRTLTQDVKSGSHEVLLGVITTLYRKREEISGSGRKFHSSDEHILNEAEKQVHREFGYVLGMDPEQVPDYIHEKLMKMDRKRA